MGNIIELQLNPLGQIYTQEKLEKLLDNLTPELNQHDRQIILRLVEMGKCIGYVGGYNYALELMELIGENK